MPLSSTSAPGYMADKPNPPKDPKPRPDRDRDVTLVFVIGGNPTTVEAKTNQRLQAAAREALRESGNEGRPLEDYQATDASGRQLDLRARIEDLGLADGATVFLNTDVGQGGSK